MKKKLKVDMPSNVNQEKIKMAIPYLKKVYFRGKKRETYNAKNGQLTSRYKNVKCVCT